MLRSIVLFFSLFLVAGYLHAEVYPTAGESGEFWEPGKTVQIKWNPELASGLINIYLWSGDDFSYKLIAGNIDSKLGTFLWTIPLEQKDGNKFRVRIQESDNPGKYQMSPSFFSIYQVFLLKQASNSEYISDYKIFPNPCYENLFLADKIFSGNYKIYNLDGRIVKEGKIKNSNYINVGVLQHGFYNLVLINEQNSIISMKFIKD